MLAKTYYETSQGNKESLSISQKWADEAFIYDQENPQILYLLAQIHGTSGNKLIAKKYCDQAITLALAQGHDSTDMVAYANKLNSL